MLSMCMENKITLTQEFKCDRCGFCCINSYPSFEHDEYKRIKKSKEAIKRNVKFVKYKFGVKNNPLSKNGKAIGVEFCYFTENGHYNYTVARVTHLSHKPCEFLEKDENGKYYCAIYSIRPSVCRDFGIKEWECPKHPEFYGKSPLPKEEESVDSVQGPSTTNNDFFKKLLGAIKRVLKD